MRNRHVARGLGLLGLILLPCLTSGCATHTGTGALTGGGLGAATGALIGGATGHAGTGALVGAGLGAATGGLIGAGLDENDRRNAERIAAASVPAQGPMSIHDVVAMSQSGVGDSVIINQIRSSASVFRLTPTDVANLHAQGVSDQVILTMQQTCYRPVVVRPGPVYVGPPPVVVYDPCPPPVVGFGVTFGRGCCR